MTLLKDRLTSLNGSLTKDDVVKECWQHNILNQKLEMPFLRWNPQKQVLEPSNDRCLAVPETLKQVENILQLMQDETVTVRFHSLRRMSETPTNATPWIWTVSSRTNRNFGTRSKIWLFMPAGYWFNAASRATACRDHHWPNSWAAICEETCAPLLEWIPNTLLCQRNPPGPCMGEHSEPQHGCTGLAYGIWPSWGLDAMDTDASVFVWPATVSVSFSRGRLGIGQTRSAMWSGWVYFSHFVAHGANFCEQPLGTAANITCWLCGHNAAGRKRTQTSANHDESHWSSFRQMHFHRHCTPLAWLPRLLQITSWGLRCLLRCDQSCLLHCARSMSTTDWFSDWIGADAIFLMRTRTVQWKSFRIIAIAFHIGERATSGHWRTALFHHHRWFAYDDGMLPVQYPELPIAIQKQAILIWLISVSDRTPLGHGQAAALARAPWALLGYVVLATAVLAGQSGAEQRLFLRLFLPGRVVLAAADLAGQSGATQVRDFLAQTALSFLHLVPLHVFHFIFCIFLTLHVSHLALSH